MIRFLVILQKIILFSAVKTLFQDNLSLRGFFTRKMEKIEIFTVQSIIFQTGSYSVPRSSSFSGG